MKTRKELREIGQFWTPDWIAENMVKYVLAENSDHIFDPSYGMGAFFVAAKQISKRKGNRVSFFGTDIDASLIEEIKTQAILTPRDVENLESDDFRELYTTLP